MSEKIGRAHHRCKMLKRLLGKNLSQDTESRICSLFGKYEESDHRSRENLAIQINEILDTSETEEEILERVGRLE